MNHAYSYDSQQVSDLLYSIIQENSTSQATNWLQQQTLPRFSLTFTAIPRFTGKNIIRLSEAQNAALEKEGIFIQGYTLDRLVRLWWLIQLPADDKEKYVQAIENLFLAADMNEQVALYSALPLLPWPAAWKLRTAEGIRSNIGLVLEAIMLNNAYPSQQLDEPAWNQLVMKAFFTDKPVHLIIGLDQRANSHLAAILRDYAHERWAAGRRVPPMLWRLVAPFVDETSFADIERAWHSENNVDKEAAALACAATAYAPAKVLLEQEPALKEEITKGILTWDTVAARIA